MKKILIVWVIVAIFLVTSLTFVGIQIKNKNQKYFTLEKDLKIIAETYIKQYPNKLPESARKLTKEEFVDAGLLTELKVDNENCEGYVEVKKTVFSYKYSPYIKCSKYFTKGYEQDV